MIIDSTQAEVLDSLCNKLNIKDNYIPHTQPKYNANTIKNKLDYWNMYIKDIVSGVKHLPIENLEDLSVSDIDYFSSITMYFLDFAQTIRNATSDILTYYKEETKQAHFTMLLYDEEIRELVHNQKGRRITYSDGEFLLELFPIVKGVPGRPFLVVPIASGEEKALMDVGEYIDRFL